MAWSNKVATLPAGRQALWFVLGFLIFGILMVYDASSGQASQVFNNKYYFLREQLKWAVIGLIGGFGAYLYDYRKLKKLALPILLGTLVLLVAVFLPGIGVRAYGAFRWINLGFTVLQPSELAKLAVILYLASWLTVREKGKLTAFLLLIGLVVGLIMAQPDMGTAIVLFSTALIIYYLSENQIWGLLALLPVMLSGVIALALSSPYRLKRLLTFFDPNTDPLGASYHIRQAQIAIGSGGLLGLGLGNSRQKYFYLPEATTDSIFAIIGEELGFVGASFLILAFALFFFEAVKMTLRVEDPFGRLLGMGIIAWLATQTLINLGSILALMPLTGVPLPFISYGGSALVMELIGVGILANIWHHNER